MSDNPNVKIMNEETNQEIEASLDDIAGLDLSGIEPYRGGEATPEGVYEWRVKSASLETKEVKSKDDPNTKVPRAVVAFKLEAIACRNVKDPAYDPAALIGVEHNENFFIKDARKDLGRVVAFLQDMGMQGSGALREMLTATIGHEFVAAVKHTKDKNDTSRVYSNIDHKTVQPLGGTKPAAPAKPAGGLFGGKK